MIQNIPINVINYIDAKGNLITNQTINKIQIRSEDDLQLLTKCQVGTRAYLHDESKIWVYGADDEWHEIVDNSNNNNNNKNGKLLVHFIRHEDGTDELDHLDATWQEIYEAFNRGGVVIEGSIWTSAVITIGYSEEFDNENPYHLSIFGEYGTGIVFYASTADTYPWTFFG